MNIELMLWASREPLGELLIKIDWEQNREMAQPQVGKRKANQREREQTSLVVVKISVEGDGKYMARNIGWGNYITSIEKYQLS